MSVYWQSTRHPWPCLLLVLPLLAIYEWFMYYLSSQGFPTFRAGLDSWLHTTLTMVHWKNEFMPGILVGLVCVAWAVIRWDRSPPENLTIVVGMFFESLILALGLSGVGVLVASSLGHLSINTRIVHSATMLGSGIFEEILFRLMGFGLLFWAIKFVTGERLALIIAMLISSAGFAAAHYLGPAGETWQLGTFVFRAVAGLCFAAIFHYRGLGIAVGTHSAYNILVGIIA